MNAISVRVARAGRPLGGFDWQQLGLALALLWLGAPLASGESKGMPSDELVSRWSGTWVTSTEATEQGEKDCCEGKGLDIPFTPKYRKIRDDYAKQADDGTQVAITNSSTCESPGVPGILAHPITYEVLFTPYRATMIFEDGTVRRIWMGKTRPPKDLQSPLVGYSTGRWEGSTLVVETTDISPSADLFMSGGIHMTPASRVEERITVVSKDTMRIQTTMTDPELFSAPYRHSRDYKKVPGTFPIGCASNNRDNGTSDVDLKPPF